MAFGPHAVFTATMSSFSTSTSAMDLGHTWEQMQLVIPAMTSNTQLHIQVSDDNSTFRRLYLMPVNSSSVQCNPVAIPATVTNAVVNIPGGYRYMKVEATAVVSFTATFKVICG